jgi:hypothetical protein
MWIANSLRMLKTVDSIECQELTFLRHFVFRSVQHWTEEHSSHDVVKDSLSVEKGSQRLTWTGLKQFEDWEMWLEHHLNHRFRLKCREANADSKPSNFDCKQLRYLSITLMIWKSESVFLTLHVCLSTFEWWMNLVIECEFLCDWWINGHFVWKHETFPDEQFFQREDGKHFIVTEYISYWFWGKPEW